MTYHCQFCGSLFDMGSDHSVEPCAPCYRAGKRIDSCGNRYTIKYGPHRIETTAEPYELTAQDGFPALESSSDIQRTS